MSAYSRSVEAGHKVNPPDVSSVGVTAVVVRTFAKESRAIRIINRHASQNLLWSIDGGTTFETIGPTGKMDEAIRAKSLQLKGSGTSTTYDVRTTEAQ